MKLAGRREGPDATSELAAAGDRLATYQLDITDRAAVAFRPSTGAATEAAASSHRTTPVDEAARTILDGIESDRFQVFVGRDASSMSKMSRLALKRATHLIRNEMKDLLDA